MRKGFLRPSTFTTLAELWPSSLLLFEPPTSNVSHNVRLLLSRFEHRSIERPCCVKMIGEHGNTACRTLLPPEGDYHAGSSSAT